MSETQQQDQNVYAIRKVVAYYVAPFMEKYRPRSPAFLEAHGAVTETGIYLYGLVTCEPKVEACSIEFTRGILACLYHSKEQELVVLGGGLNESARFGGMITNGGAFDSRELAVRFLRAALGQIRPSKDLLFDFLEKAEAVGEPVGGLRIKSPEDLYDKLAEVTVGLIAQMPDPARDVAREIGFFEKLGMEDPGTAQGPAVNSPAP